MIAVIQRVSEASVKIEEQIKGLIHKGYVILLGIGQDDSEEDINWLTSKIINLRIFSDKEGKMNLNLQEVDGDILLISQFTLFASTKKGNRPSFIEAAKPDLAVSLYKKTIQVLEEKLAKKIRTGEFGADMKVTLTNDGPVTIIIDTKNKK